MMEDVIVKEEIERYFMLPEFSHLRWDFKDLMGAQFVVVYDCLNEFKLEIKWGRIYLYSMNKKQNKKGKCHYTQVGDSMINWYTALNRIKNRSLRINS